MQKIIKFEFNGQLRRFAISEKTNFVELKRKISSLVKVQEEVINVKYIDDEKDLISISSETEFQEALRCSGNGILRINVSRNVKKREEEARNSKGEQNRKRQEKALPFFIPMQLLSALMRQNANNCFKFSQNKDVGERKPKRNESKNGISTEEKKSERQLKEKQSDDLDLCGDLQEKNQGTEETLRHKKKHNFGAISCPKDLQRFKNVLKYERKKQKKNRQHKRRQERRRKIKEQEEAAQIDMIHESSPFVKTTILNKSNESETKKTETKKNAKESDFMKKENQKISREKKEVNPFMIKLQDLSKMGFSDEKENMTLLVKHNGNVIGVVNEIISRYEK